jgi:hypothetical protein
LSGLRQFGHIFSPRKDRNNFPTGSLHNATIFFFVYAGSDRSTEDNEIHNDEAKKEKILHQRTGDLFADIEYAQDELDEKQEEYDKYLLAIIHYT